MVKTFSHPNMPYPTTPDNVPLTPETISSPYAPFPTTLAVMSAKAAPQNLLLYALYNVFSTPGTYFSSNMP